MGFPFEIITMLGSTLLGGLMSVWAESRKAKAEQQKLLITRGEFDMKARKQSLDHGLKAVSYTHLTLPTICSV